MGSIRSDFLKTSGECPLSLLMRCYYASSPYARALYKERMALGNERSSGKRPLTNMEAIHQTHLIGFIRHLKTSRSLENQPVVKGFDPKKFGYKIPVTREFEDLRKLTSHCGLMWIEHIQSNHAFARGLLYDYPPEEGEKPQLILVNSDGGQPDHVFAAIPDERLPELALA